MNTKILLAAVLGVVVGLISGFTVANSINRNEINALRGQAEQAKKPAANSTSAPDGFTLSDEEIKAKIAEADGSPTNFSFQKNLGGALYRYATMKNDPKILDESVRLLTRANSIDPKDYEVTVALGNALFDVGYFKKDAETFKKARTLYETALDAKPNDAEVRTDLAITYILEPTPDMAKAVSEFQRAIKADPKQERALIFLTQAYMQQGNWADAGKTLEQLKTANPKNDKIADLASQIETKQAVPIK